MLRLIDRYNKEELVACLKKVRDKYDASMIKLKREYKRKNIYKGKTEKTNKKIVDLEVKIRQLSADIYIFSNKLKEE